MLLQDKYGKLLFAFAETFIARGYCISIVQNFLRGYGTGLDQYTGKFNVGRTLESAFIDMIHSLTGIKPYTNTIDSKTFIYCGELP